MRKVLLVVSCVALVGGAAQAHHSYAATYDTTRQITLEGKLVQFVYRNPHSFVHIQAPDDDGALQRWSVEWSGTSQLTRQGIERQSLRVGDEVVIVGRPSRVQGEYRALMLSLSRPADGFTWGQQPGEAVE